MIEVLKEILSELEDRSYKRHPHKAEQVGVPHQQPDFSNEFSLYHSQQYKGAGDSESSTPYDWEEIHNEPLIETDEDEEAQQEQASSKQAINIVVLGSPGTYRAEVSEQIAEQLSLQIIAPKDQFAELLNKQDKIGELAQKIKQKTTSLPNKLAVQLAKQQIEKHDTTQGLLFESFPNTTLQADALENLLSQRNGKVDFIVHLDRSEDDIINTLSQHSSEISPEGEKAEVLKTVFRQKKQQIQPIVNYYQHKAPVITVNASGNPDQVYQQVLKQIRKKIDQLNN